MVMPMVHIGVVWMRVCRASSMLMGMGAGYRCRMRMLMMVVMYVLMFMFQLLMYASAHAALSDAAIRLPP